MLNYCKPTILASVVVSTFYTPSFAQSLTWWDILSPDRLMDTITRYAVVLARTQVDLTFDDISTNLRGNRTTISNLRIWPATPWHERGVCQVGFERFTISGQAFDNLDNATIRIDAYETTVTPGCIPPELWTVMGRMELDELSFPNINVNVDYHIPSSGAKVSVLASVADVVEASAAADFDYVAVRTTPGRGDPFPIAVLTKASVELHNLGGWETASRFLPPIFTDKETAAVAIEDILRTAFKEMNSQSFDLESDELSVLQLAFVSSATTAWTDFLATPDQIVLETNIASERPAYLNFWGYEDNPSWVVRDLNPIMRARMSQVPTAIPKEVINTVLAGAWHDLPEDTRLEVGLALARGEGVPSNLALASDILMDLAEAGNGDAVAAIAEALEIADPESSYFWSLHAGASGEIGAVSRLDRLEGTLPLPTILRIQGQALDTAESDAALPTSIVSIRERARNHLTGIGEHRSYQAAHTWASVGAALSDPASVAIGEEISKTLDAAQDAEAKSAVGELRRLSSSSALTLWSELIPVLGASGQSADRPADEAADDALVISDAELESCRRLFVTTLPKDFVVGGSCASNNVVLMRELALTSQNLDALRSQMPVAPSAGDGTAPALSNPDVALPELRSPRNQLETELAARTASETAIRAENAALRQELAANASKQAEAERAVALMNAQISELRSQLTTLQTLLDTAAEKDREASVRIEALGSQLNTALARAAAEQKKRAELAEAEARRLAQEASRPPSDAQAIERFRSGFLAGLEGFVANRSDVTVAGDRLVFSSGALFQPGSTTLSPTGRAQIAEVMDRFTGVAEQIPSSVDWIIRVDGHTDDIPITSGAFVDNWELSQARALSVVRYLTEERAFPPHRLAAVGFGEYRPVNPESTAAARAQNRRIELFLTMR